MYSLLRGWGGVRKGTRGWRRRSSLWVLEGICELRLGRGACSLGGCVGSLLLLCVGEVEVRGQRAVCDCDLVSLSSLCFMPRLEIGQIGFVSERVILTFDASRLC